MRIAIDAMGSDAAPDPEIEGALRANVSGDVELVLVGDEVRLKAVLRNRAKGRAISTVHASEVITMDDNPLMAVRKKKDASLLVAMRLVKQGVADAFVSAGNTGAVMLAARTILRPIRGVGRAAICQLLPTIKGPCLVLDLGANVDCSARHLCEFAEMGVVYSREVLGKDNPRVGQLNIGEEQVKGNDLARTVHRNLSAAPHINFVGNVEPKGMYAGVADVVVCDGFVGNVVLKTSEGAAAFIRNLLAKELRSSWVSMLGALLSQGAYKRLKRTVDPNEYGGAPLLGINGVVMIMHGACSGKGVAHAIEGACTAVKHNVNKHIEEGISQLRATEARLESSGTPVVQEVNARD
jgi:phosphate acyltransferase